MAGQLLEQRISTIHSKSMSFL